MKVHPLFQGMPFLCRKIENQWGLLRFLIALTIPSGAIFILLQAVRVTKPNIPEAIRRNYELMWVYPLPELSPRLSPTSHFIPLRVNWSRARLLFPFLSICHSPLNCRMKQACQDNHLGPITMIENHRAALLSSDAFKGARGPCLCFMAHAKEDRREIGLSRQAGVFY